jgi:hypothetical protein
LVVAPLLVLKRTSGADLDPLAVTHRHAAGSGERVNTCKTGGRVSSMSSVHRPLLCCCWGGIYVQYKVPKARTCVTYVRDSSNVRYEQAGHTGRPTSSQSLRRVVAVERNPAKAVRPRSWLGCRCLLRRHLADGTKFFRKRFGCSSRDHRSYGKIDMYWIHTEGELREGRASDNLPCGEDRFLRVTKSSSHAPPTARELVRSPVAPAVVSSSDEEGE